MRKTFRRCVSCLALAALLALLLSFSAFASIARVRTRVMDRDGILPDGAAETIRSDAERALSGADFDLLFYFYRRSGSLIYGEDLIATEHLDTTSLVILIVCDDPYDGGIYYDLYTYGTANSRISDRNADRILDDRDVYNNLKAGNYIAGCSAFASLTADIYMASSSASQSRPSLVKCILISLLISVVIAGIVAGVVFYGYKKKLKSPIYPLSRFAQLKLTVSHDTFMGSSVVRTPISTGSSGGSSGGRSGGSSHGGGGGHRGGR